MPTDWPTKNSNENKETPSVTVEVLESKRLEIIKLKTEIDKEEEGIALIPKEIDRDIAQNLLESKRGLLEIRINEYDKLKQKIHA